MNNWIFLCKLNFGIFIPTLLLFFTFLPSHKHILFILIYIWLINLFFTLLLNKDSRIFNVFWLFLTLYNITALFGLKYFNLDYPPFPQEETIIEGTFIGLRGIWLAYTFASIVFFKFDWKNWIKNIVSGVSIQFEQVKEARLYLCGVFVILIGLIDSISLLRLGLLNIFVSERRHFSGELLSTSNHNIQILGISISILLIIGISRYRRNMVLVMYGMSGLFLYWIPFLLVGSRKELIYLFGAITIYFMYNKKISKTFLFIITVVGIVFFLLPGLIGNSMEFSFHEFILPQYMLFTLLESNVNIDYNYFQGTWFLLPGFLRLYNTESLGVIFFNAGLTNVGVGGNPVAEAYVNNHNFVVIIFAIVTVIFLLLIVLLSRINPWIGLIGLSYGFVWGRSDLWITLFFILYTGLIIKLICYRGRGPLIKAHKYHYKSL